MPDQRVSIFPSFANSAGQELASTNLLSPALAEKSIPSNPSPLANPAEMPSATAKLGKPSSMLVTLADPPPVAAPPERKKLKAFLMTCFFLLSGIRKKLNSFFINIIYSANI